MSNIYSIAKDWIKPLQETVAITLHHDGITGTSKQLVVDDYMRMLDNAIFSSEDVIIVAFQKLMNTTLVPNFCHQFNISQCLVTESLSDENLLQITVYNPFAHNLLHYLSLPIIEPVVQIIDGNGEEIDSQVCFENFFHRKNWLFIYLFLNILKDCYNSGTYSQVERKKIFG
jgi:hypothetical protein